MKASNITIVITDGQSDNEFLMQSAAAALVQQTYLILNAIGFGSADINGLHTIVL